MDRKQGEITPIIPKPANWSNNTILAVCTEKKSTRCRGNYSLFANELDKIFPNGLSVEKNSGICIYCSDGGKDNVEWNEDYFSIIDNDQKAYYLGCIAGRASFNKNSLTVDFSSEDCDIRDELVKVLYKKVPGKLIYGSFLPTLEINSSKIVHHIADRLGLSSHHKLTDFPKFEQESLSFAFLRGYFESQGKITDCFDDLMCWMHGGGSFLLGVKELIGYCDQMEKDTIYFQRVNALDFLGKIYGNCGGLCLKTNKDLFLKWASWVPTFTSFGRQYLTFKWAKKDENAVAPFKKRASDSGYDLTLLKLLEAKDNGIERYDTGVQIQPDHGWYFDLVARSSLWKYGRILAASGIIDNSYRGSLSVIMYKFDGSAPPLELPGRYVQLIPRPIVHFEFEETDLGSTGRGDAGFGSSGLTTEAR